MRRLSLLQMRCRASVLIGERRSWEDKAGTQSIQAFIFFMTSRVWWTEDDKENWRKRTSRTKNMQSWRCQRRLRWILFLEAIL